jgi:hypothetical protein
MIWVEFCLFKKKHIPLFIRRQTNTICGNVACFSQCTHGRVHFLSHCFTAPWCPNVLDQANDGLLQWPLHKRYVTSLYLAVTTFSTVRYGDLHPESQAKMIFSMIYMIWNIGFAAYIGLQITSMIERIVNKHVSNILFKLLLHMLCVFNVFVLNSLELHSYALV